MRFLFLFFSLLAAEPAIAGHPPDLFDTLVAETGQINDPGISPQVDALLDADAGLLDSGAKTHLTHPALAGIQTCDDLKGAAVAGSTFARSCPLPHSATTSAVVDLQLPEPGRPAVGPHPKRRHAHWGSIG